MLLKIIFVVTFSLFFPPFSNVAVPAKAIEIYLDLRRSIEEQVRVSYLT